MTGAGASACPGFLQEASEVLVDDLLQNVGSGAMPSALRRHVFNADWISTRHAHAEPRAWHPNPSFLDRTTSRLVCPTKSARRVSPKAARLTRLISRRDSGA